MIHLVIPDTQVRPGVPTDHLGWIGKYILDILPDVVVHLGDHWDMPSLSQYDEGKVRMEGRRVQDDFDVGNKALRDVYVPALEYNERKKKNKEKQYNPRWVLTLGNHENRIDRYVEANPKLQGAISVKCLDAGPFEVHPFLHPVEVDGVWYSHYFYNPMNGRPYAGMMETRIKNVGFSFTMGHQQGKKVGERQLGNGKMQRGLVVGSCYLHDENYIGPQGNYEWRGVVVKHEVRDGNYDLMEVSLDYLCRKYEQMRLDRFLNAKYGGRMAA